MILHYELKFYDYWHLSSGLSGGAKLDSTVVKDKNYLPYVPGKTIKGLAREMAYQESCDFLNRCFGTTSDKSDKCYSQKHKLKSSQCYFTNATIKKEIEAEIISNNLQDNLYDIIASTQIDENGIAKTNSLREIEVVIPLSLSGEIKDIETNEDLEKIKNALKKIKRMGLNRNRGLGRCEFIIGEVQ